jgi:dihydroneopterin aldolase
MARIEPVIEFLSTAAASSLNGLAPERASHASVTPLSAAITHVAGRMDIVFIEGLTLDTIIGIGHDEQHVKQPVRVDLAMGVERIDACVTDHMDDTIDYAGVRDALQRLFASHSFRLLESLAEAIARLTIAEFGAHWVRVSLAKPAKFPDLRAVGVTIERQRRDAVMRAHAAYAALGYGLVPN